MPDLQYHQLEYWHRRQYLGSRLVRMIETNGGRHALLQHTLFICAHCGGTWGKRIWHQHPSYNRGEILFRPHMRNCADSATNILGEVAGSLIHPGEDISPWVQELPSDLIQYEAKLRLRIHEKLLEPTHV